MKGLGKFQMLSVPALLINTALQWGDGGVDVTRNRFNGFGGDWKTVETVSHSITPFSTSLKRGVNETATKSGQQACEMSRAVNWFS